MYSASGRVHQDGKGLPEACEHWNTLEKGSTDKNIIVDLEADMTLPWWQAFHDEALSSLIAQSLTFNKDIKAAERLLASNSALTAASFTDLLPKLTLSGFFGVQESNLYHGRPVAVYWRRLLILVN